MNYSFILNGAKHKLIKRYLGPFWWRRAWLEKTQWYEPAQFEDLQEALLRKLLVHAQRHIKFYRDGMNEYGVKLNGGDCREELAKLPLLNKQQVLAAGSEIVSSKHPRFFNSVGLTGGTTGTPLRIQRNLFSLGNEHAFVRRQWDWAGIGLRDVTAYLSGRKIIAPDQTDGELFAYDPFMKELALSTYHLSEKVAASFARAIKRYKAKALVGYASAIYYFAQLCLEQSLDVTLSAALTTSEMLHGHMRDVIEKAFGCQVFDFYGAAERVAYFFTCEKGRYHVQQEYGLTEFLPMQGEYEGKHRIVATGFWNHAMPLIRYDTGDLVELSDEKCPCQRTLPVVKGICGRAGDLIVTPSGRHFAPTLMARVFKMAHNIKQTQLIQDAIDHLQVTYVPSADFSAADFEEFEINVRSYMPSELNLEFKQVEQVEKTASGKTNFIVSRL